MPIPNVPGNGANLVLAHDAVRDSQGNLLYSVGKDGSVFGQSMTFPDGTSQNTAASSGAIANSTTTAFPYLSSANTFSNSPLFRVDANTVALKPTGSFLSRFIVYNGFTDDNNNDGIRLDNVVSGFPTLESFANGTGTARDLYINAPSSHKISFRNNGNEQAYVDGTNFNFRTTTQLYGNLGLSGVGLAPVVGVLGLDNHNDLNRTDTIYTAGSGVGLGKQGGYLLCMAYNVKTIEAGTTLTVTIGWSDENSVARTAVFSCSLAALTNSIAIALPIYLGSGSAVTAHEVITGGAGVGAYDARGGIIQIM